MMHPSEVGIKVATRNQRLVRRNGNTERSVAVGYEGFHSSCLLLDWECYVARQAAAEGRCGTYSLASLTSGPTSICYGRGAFVAWCHLLVTKLHPNDDFLSCKQMKLLFLLSSRQNLLSFGIVIFSILDMGGNPQYVCLHETFEA
jgi:hypothetical protein